VPLSANPVVTLFVNSRRWSSLRVVFSDKKLYGNCLYWLNILYQKFFALPWKTEFAVKFSTAWNIFFIIQDFWGTCACPEKQSCPEIFHSIEIFFFIQGFWATCERLLWKTEVPRKFSLYWNIFYHLFLSSLRLPWKQSLPWINCIEYIFFTIQDFWATCACPEKHELSWTNCIEYIFFIIQDFWATCACPEIFQDKEAAAPPPDSYAYASDSNMGAPNLVLAPDAI